MLKTFMKSKFNFTIVSITIFIFSIITICCAPIINKIYDDFENWKSLNCGIFSDLINSKDIGLNDYENYKYLKSLCQRQKSMYDLEYTSLIFSTTLSFICFCLSLFIQLEIGTNYKNKIGLFSFFSGIICFILTFIYVCYSGYIFNNDIAYGKIEQRSFNIDNSIKKLFPNGATYKLSDNKYITAYDEDTNDYSNFIKYKDLGDRIYNYDEELSIKYYSNMSCFMRNVTLRQSPIDYSCKYIFTEPNLNPSNKYLYERWMATLVLSSFIFIFNICLSLLGFKLYKDKKEELKSLNTINMPKEIQINNFKKNSEILNIKVAKTTKYRNNENDIFKIREQIYKEYKNNAMIKDDEDKVDNDNNDNEKGSNDKNNQYIKI